VLNRVDVPVLATGGLATGRHMAAALAASADGVRMGPLRRHRRVWCTSRWKQAIVEAQAGDTVVTDAFSVMWPGSARSRGRCSPRRRRRCPCPTTSSARSRSAIDRWTSPRFAFVAPLPTTTGRIEAMPMYAGESAAAIEPVEPAAQLVRQIADEASALLRRWGRKRI
jgi:nitronate monooxygenase